MGCICTKKSRQPIHTADPTPIIPSEPMREDNIPQSNIGEDVRIGDEHISNGMDGDNYPREENIDDEGRGREGDNDDGVQGMGIVDKGIEQGSVKEEVGKKDGVWDDDSLEVAEEGIVIQMVKGIGMMRSMQWDRDEERGDVDKKGKLDRNIELLLESNGKGYPTYKILGTTHQNITPESKEKKIVDYQPVSPKPLSSVPPTLPTLPSPTNMPAHPLTPSLPPPIFTPATIPSSSMVSRPNWLSIVSMPEVSTPLSPPSTTLTEYMGGLIHSYPRPFSLSNILAKDTSTVQDRRANQGNGNIVLVSVASGQMGAYFNDIDGLNKNIKNIQNTIIIAISGIDVTFNNITVNGREIGKFSNPKEMLNMGKRIISELKG